MYRLPHDPTDTADILFLLIDEHAQIRKSNPFTSEITGFTSDEMIGKDWIDLFISAEDKEETRQIFDTNLESRDPHWSDESTIVCKDGTTRIVRWSNTLSLDASDGSALVLSLGTDNTELVDILERSKNDERRYKRLLDNLPQHIYQKDPDSNYLSCNKSFADDLGKSPEEVVGSSDLDYFPPELANRYREDDARIIKEGRRVDLVEEYIDRLGHHKSVKSIKTPIYDEGGDSEGLVGIFWDISQEVEAKRQLEETKEMLTNAEHIAHIGSWRLDISKDRLSWSDETYVIFEVDKERSDVDYELFLEHVHPEERDAVNQAYLASLKTRQPYKIEHRLKMRDGRIKTVLEQCRTSFDEDGTPLVSMGSVQDITELREVDHEIIRQAALLRSVIDATPDLIFYKDYRELDGSYMGCNRAFEMLVDRHEGETIGTDDKALFGEALGRSIREKDKEVLTTGKTMSDEEWVDYPDGRHILLQTLRTPLLDLDEEIRGVIGVSRDITSRWRAEQRISEQSEALRHQANHDGLTGLPNRTLLNDRLTKAISKSSRVNVDFALLFIDLDQFKQINDSFGHAKGDTILKKVAQRLDTLIRDEDTLSRIGGDEFVIMLEQLHQPQHASIMAEKIIKALREPVRDGDHELYLTASIGISVFPQDGNDAEDLLKNADAAMYKAKELGRNNYQFYDAEMTKVAYERILMESDLRRAIKEKELILFYQPKIDLAHDRIEGFEVLLRWQHPRHGLIMPSQFLPIAEESGMIVEIGEFVLERAVKQLALWQDTFIDVGHISINISTRQLQQRDFFERFIAILETHACPANKIWLEISEEFISKDPSRNIPILKKFVDYGLRIAIDDFGKGSSSLNFLKHLPVDQLKIDQSFTQAFPADIAIIKAIISVAKSLKLDVIAKGVETLEQSKSLKEEGYTEAQGFLYGRPANAYQTSRLIRSRTYA